MNPLPHTTPHRLGALILTIALALPLLAALPQTTLNLGITASTGSKDIAPHYLTANRWGTLTQRHNALFNAGITINTDTTRRLSWGAALELWTGYSSSANYARYDADNDAFIANSQHPARFWLQQAYIEGKYRGVIATFGSKQRGSAFVNDRLSSGDLIRSANARPIPGLQIGFVNFQNIPLTKGWVQIDGEVGFFRTADSKWLENHYNRYNLSLTTGHWTNYQRLHLRSKPDQPVVVTVGLQTACQFGGTRTFYYHGLPDNNFGSPRQAIKMPSNFKAFFHALIPGTGKQQGDEFCEGNHIGTWDIAANIRLTNGSLIRAYTQWLWEDGSGLGKLNSFDGLWGIEFRNSKQQIVDGAVFEVLSLTNQSGPIHWAPGDHPNTPLTQKATGADNYYNNFAFNGYQSRGMAIGSPLLVEPLRNTDGYMGFADNAIKAVHAAISGHFSPQWQYRIMASRRKSLGTPLVPHSKPRYATSLLVELGFSPKSLPALQLQAQFATDHGTLSGNNTAALLAASYSFHLNKKAQ